MFSPNDAAFKRMQVFHEESQIEPQHDAYGVAGPALCKRRRAPNDDLHVLETVEVPPSLAISLLPLGLRYLAMVGDAVVKVIFVEVGVHPYTAVEQGAVIFRSRQRGEDEKL